MGRASHPDITLIAAHMNRWIPEWLWRLALLAALCWIGWELHQINQNLLDAPTEEMTAEPSAAAV
jgi:hypothetical protein